MCKNLSEIHDGFVLALCKNSFSKDNNKKALTAAELTSLKYGMWKKEQIRHDVKCDMR